VDSGECVCAGVSNGDGFGDTCDNNEADESYPYCYVNKDICQAAGVEFFESSSNTLDTSTIGWSNAVCSSAGHVAWDSCEADFAAFAEGVADDTSGDTQACRNYHLGVASQQDPDVHCPHASADGGGVCILVETTIVPEDTSTAASASGDGSSATMIIIIVAAVVVILVGVVVFKKRRKSIAG